jgi:hypothetical protein
MRTLLVFCAFFIGTLCLISLNNSNYHRMLDICKADKKTCECFARIVENDLTRKEFNRLMLIVKNNKTAEYILSNDDKISKALKDTTLICMP